MRPGHGSMTTEVFDLVMVGNTRKHKLAVPPGRGSKVRSPSGMTPTHRAHSLHARSRQREGTHAPVEPIEGRRFNSETATVVTRWTYQQWGDADAEATLYETPDGAFFLVHHWPATGKIYLDAISRDEVRAFLERHVQHPD